MTDFQKKVKILEKLEKILGPEKLYKQLTDPEIGGTVCNIINTLSKYHT